jgi:hypothetical protein
LPRLTALVALVSDAEHVPQRAGQVTQAIWVRERFSALPLQGDDGLGD